MRGWLARRGVRRWTRHRCSPCATARRHATAPSRGPRRASPGRDSGVRRANRLASAARSPAPTCRSEIRVPSATSKELSAAPAEDPHAVPRTVMCLGGHLCGGPVFVRRAVAAKRAARGRRDAKSRPRFQRRDDADAAERASSASRACSARSASSECRCRTNEVVELRGHPVLRMRWCGVVASGSSPPAVREIGGWCGVGGVDGVATTARCSL